MGIEKKLTPEQIQKFVSANSETEAQKQELLAIVKSYGLNPDYMIGAYQKMMTQGIEPTIMRNILIFNVRDQDGKIDMRTEHPETLVTNAIQVQKYKNQHGYDLTNATNENFKKALTFILGTPQPEEIVEVDLTIEQQRYVANKGSGRFQAVGLPPEESSDPYKGINPHIDKRNYH